MAPQGQKKSVPVQILVPGDPKGALVLAVLASGILGDPGADGGGKGKSEQAEKYGAKEK